MELELDGEPRNREAVSRDESPHATRWRVGQEEIVADADPALTFVRVRVGQRTVGELPPQGGSLRFTVAPGGSYRGGDHVEARIHRDARMGNLTLWVDGIEVTPFSRPDPFPPHLPRHVPSPWIPPESTRTTAWVRGALLSVLVALFAIPTFLYLRDRPDRPKAATPDLETKTAECLRRADAEAAAAKARLGGDPVSRMQHEPQIDDQRRLARISCKEHERDCKRDPRSLPCIMNAK